MDINFLLNQFKYAVRYYTNDNMAFLNTISLVSDYIMYEQSIVKKDNVDKYHTDIIYSYDKLSYDAINDFISSINFIEEPIVGANKNVVLNGTIYDKDLEKKIYLLDKIKDSFMHLDNGNTKYEFIDSFEKIAIENTYNDYSLKCIIPSDSLSKFNSTIRDNYYKIDPEIKWVHEMSKKMDIVQEFDFNRFSKLKDYNLCVYKYSPLARVIFSKKNPQRIYIQHYSLKNMKSESEYLSYHTYSYLSLLRITDDASYPLLNELYKLDFRCSNATYVDKARKMIESMILFYGKYNSNSYIPEDKLQLIVERYISSFSKSFVIVNRELLRSLRNARSHANKIGDKKFNITYYDVKYNSIKLNSNLNSTPIFILKATNKEMDTLFDVLNSDGISDVDFTNELIQDMQDFSHNGYTDKFLKQIYLFILQCKKDGISNDVDKLLLPAGNANNFVDFAFKCLNCSYKCLNDDNDISPRKLS